MKRIHLVLMIDLILSSFALVGSMIFYIVTEKKDIHLVSFSGAIGLATVASFGLFLMTKEYPRMQIIGAVWFLICSWCTFRIFYAGAVSKFEITRELYIPIGGLAIIFLFMITFFSKDMLKS